MFHEGEDLIEILPAMVICFVLTLMSFLAGVAAGEKRQKAESVRAGVALWGCDEWGNAKFEYRK